MTALVLYGAPVLFALLAWWFSTGAILYLDGLPKRTFRWTMFFVTLALVPAIYGLVNSSQVTTGGAAYAGFASALIIWAWLELSFLTGLVTGPRREACPDNCAEVRGGVRHFLHAVQAILYHEIAVAAFAGAAVALTWGQPNQTGTWTILLLWAMRLSAKLNLHFGVPNLSEEFLPPHLAYLGSYLRRRPMNLFFPVSVTASTAILALLLVSAGRAVPGSAEATGLLLVASLMLLAILEHWFMVLPVHAAALWRWGFRSREQAGALGAKIPGEQVVLRGVAATGFVPDINNLIGGKSLTATAPPSFDSTQ